MQTILIVDDNINITKPLQALLKQKGYRTVLADNGQNAIYTARHAKPDLILLDIMMPVLDGFGFIGAFRKESQVPIILISAKLEQEDKIKGLRLGADDYITKPIPMAELLARIEAVLRRYQKTHHSTILRIAELELNSDAQLLTLKGKTVDLTPSEFDLIQLFMENPMRTFSRLELLEKLELNAETSERMVDYHIVNLRKKIEDKPKKPRFIETVFAKGYRFRTID